MFWLKPPGGCGNTERKTKCQSMAIEILSPYPRVIAVTFTPNGVTFIPNLNFQDLQIKT